jgi:DNA-binding NtrC family response regulator
MTAMSTNTRRKILVVDNEKALLNALYDGLTDRSFDVMVCMNGAEALGQLHPNSHDLLVVDLMMPELNGIDFLKRALAIDPNPAGIVMTGEATLSTPTEAVNAGAFEYVLKPFKTATLLPVLERAMNERGMKLTETQ